MTDHGGATDGTAENCLSAWPLPLSEPVASARTTPTNLSVPLKKRSKFSPFESPSSSYTTLYQADQDVVMHPQPHTTTTTTASTSSSSTRFHAHFDCFSGAAGDMMLASCLDAADHPEQLAQRVVEAIQAGMPLVGQEFVLHHERVWRGMGSICARHVTVDSIYHHQPVPVPAKVKKDQEVVVEDAHNHTHSHGHSHTCHNHEHEREEDEEENEPIQSAPNTIPTKPDGNNTLVEKGDGEVFDHSHSHSHAPHHSAHSHSHDHAGASTTSQNKNTKGPLRNLPEIREMLQNAPVEHIPLWVKEVAIEAFTELARAEAAVHGAETEDAVHFHEVGAVDSIVDTVGTLLALHFLQVETVSCSPLPLGEGTVWTAHGLLPVPAPATLHLMIGMRTTPGPVGLTGELVTPTAAALLKVLTKRCAAKVGPTNHHSGRPPHFTIRKVGIGAGSKDFENHPNIVRLILGNDLVLDHKSASIHTT